MIVLMLFSTGQWVQLGPINLNCPAAGGAYVDHYGGIIRNNFVFVNDSSANLSGNLQYQSLSLFVNGVDGDLHLASSAAVAIDEVTAPYAATGDID